MPNMCIQTLRKLTSEIMTHSITTIRFANISQSQILLMIQFPIHPKNIENMRTLLLKNFKIYQSIRKS